MCSNGLLQGSLFFSGDANIGWDANFFLKVAYSSTTSLLMPNIGWVKKKKKEQKKKTGSFTQNSGNCLSVHRHLGLSLSLSQGEERGRDGSPNVASSCSCRSCSFGGGSTSRRDFSF